MQIGRMNEIITILYGIERLFGQLKKESVDQQPDFLYEYTKWPFNMYLDH